jgi:hypothetical protein
MFVHSAIPAFGGQWCAAKDAPRHVPCACGGHIFPVFSGAYAFYDTECADCQNVRKWRFLNPGVSDWTFAVMCRFKEAHET